MNPLTTGKIGGVLVTYPADKAGVVAIAEKDPIAIELIAKRKFELEKFEQCLINWPNEFSRIKVRSVADCFELSTPSLITIKKYKGEFKALACVCKFLEEVYSFFNVTNTLSDLQLQMTAQLILEEYYFLTIADIRLCFFNAYKNKYGKLFNRLDGSIILDWLKIYTQDRAVEAQRRSEIESSRSKDIKMDKETAAKIRSFYEAVKDKEPVTTERVYYPSFSLYEKTLTEDQDKYITEAINSLYEVYSNVQTIGNEEQLMNFESFRSWKEQKIVFRINKGSSLSDILEGLKAGKI